MATYQQEQEGREMIYSVGFRGVNDEPFWNMDTQCVTDQCRGQTITQAIGNQTAIASSTPSVHQPRFVSYMWMELLGLREEGWLVGGAARACVISCYRVMVLHGHRCDGDCCAPSIHPPVASQCLLCPCFSLSCGVQVIPPGTATVWTDFPGSFNILGVVNATAGEERSSVPRHNDRSAGEARCAAAIRQPAITISYRAFQTAHRLYLCSQATASTRTSR